MTYAEFWRGYLRAHSSRHTRVVHYAGSLLALGAVSLAIARLNWHWALLAPLVGYGFAWPAHLFIEHNRPQTFLHPVWSLASDYRMLTLALSGRLGPHLERARRG